MFSRHKPLQPPPSNFNLLTPPPQFPSTDNLFGSQVMTKEKKEEEKEKIIDEIDNKIYESPDLPKLELGDGLLNTLGAEAKDILEDRKPLRARRKNNRANKGRI